MRILIGYKCKDCKVLFKEEHEVKSHKDIHKHYNFEPIYEED